MTTTTQRSPAIVTADGAMLTELPLGVDESGIAWDFTSGNVNAINDNGKVAGRIGIDGVTFHAAHWLDGAPTDLQAPVSEFTDVFSKSERRTFVSEACAVNAAGSTVGFVQATDVIFMLGGELRFVIDVAVQDMRTIFPGKAFDINAAGQVVGYSFQGTQRHGTTITQAGQHAVLWDNFTTTSLLGPFSGDHLTAAYAINNLGQVVGAGTTLGGFGGFIWQNGQLDTLGDTRPRSINDAAQVVGAAASDRGLDFPVAFQWDRMPCNELRAQAAELAQEVQDKEVEIATAKAEVIDDPAHIDKWLAEVKRLQAELQVLTAEQNALNGQIATVCNSGMTLLPFLPGHGISDAFAINEHGQSVGYSQDEHVASRRAVMWSEGAAHDLTALLPAKSGWILGMATGINDDGQIVGLGVHNGNRKGFVLTPPPNLRSPKVAAPRKDPIV